MVCIFNALLSVSECSNIYLYILFTKKYIYLYILLNVNLITTRNFSPIFLNSFFSECNIQYWCFVLMFYWLHFSDSWLRNMISICLLALVVFSFIGSSLIDQREVCFYVIHSIFGCISVYRCLFWHKLIFGWVRLCYRKGSSRCCFWSFMLYFTLLLHVSKVCFQ